MIPKLLLFTVISILTLSLILTPYVNADTIVPEGESLELDIPIRPGIECRPDGPDRRVSFPENFNDGSRIEVWCDGAPDAGFVLKYFDKNGNLVAKTGACLFLPAQNTITKVMDGEFHIYNSSGVIFTNGGKLNSTVWNNYDTTGLTPLPSFVAGPFPSGFPPKDTLVASSGWQERDDWEFRADYSAKEIVVSKTTHQGKIDWVTNDTKGNIDTDFKTKDLKKIENKTKPFSDTLTTGLTNDFAFQTPTDSDSFQCSFHPEDIFRTTIPVMGILDGEEATFSVVLNQNHILKVSKLEAIANQAFSFDINILGEEANVVSYTLDSAPEGMSINENGVLKWMPTLEGIGTSSMVTIKSQYMDTVPQTSSFNITVKPPGHVTMNPKYLTTFNLVELSMFDGNIQDIIVDYKTKSFSLIFDSGDQGLLSMILPRDFIDSKIGPKDADFNIMIDGKMAEFSEVYQDSDYRVLEIFTFPTEKSSLKIIDAIMSPPKALTPLKQSQLGVEPSDTVCKNDLTLIFKQTGAPACVKPSSVANLIERGWASS